MSRISFRFEFKFGVAAVLALIHDTIVVLGIFAILGRQVNSPFIAAVLTIIGYSINDTIVIYDKIRENLRLRKKDTVPEIANISILQTMRRSIYTVLTTLLAVAALYLFGGVSIRDFSLAIIIGLVAGTYSSIFVAPSIWVEWTLRIEKGLSPYNASSPEDQASYFCTITVNTLDHPESINTMIQSRPSNATVRNTP